MRNAVRYVALGAQRDEIGDCTGLIVFRDNPIVHFG